MKYPSRLPRYSERRIAEGVRWLEEAMAADPIVSPWALFTFLEKRYTYQKESS